MAYLKINNVDYSHCVNKLLVDTKHKYVARENASGNMLVKYVATKHNIQVGIIPLNSAELSSLLTSISGANAMDVKVEFLSPETNALYTAQCILPVNSVEWYSIRVGNTMSKAFTLTFEEK